MLERLRRAAGLFAAHGELRPAARDGDVERGFNLPQILVERAAQAREPLVVHGIEAHLDRLRPHPRSSPRRECGWRSVTRTSTKRPSRVSGPAKLTMRLLPVRPASSLA